MVLLKHRFGGGKFIKSYCRGTTQKKTFLSVTLKITNKTCMLFFIYKEDINCRHVYKVVNLSSIVQGGGRGGKNGRGGGGGGGNHMVKFTGL